MKSSRIKSKKNREKVQGERCVCCFAPPPTDCDHIGTRGAGAGDGPNEIWSLCRECHVRKHAMGLNRFIENYPHLKEVLIDKGWEFNEFRNRWLRAV